MATFLILLALLAPQLMDGLKLVGPTKLGSLPSTIGNQGGYIQPCGSSFYIKDSKSFFYVDRASNSWPCYAVLSDASNMSLSQYSLLYTSNARGVKLELGSTIISQAYFTGFVSKGKLHLKASKIGFQYSSELNYGSQSSANLLTYGDFVIEYTEISLGVYSDTYLNLNGPGYIRAPITTGRKSSLKIQVTGDLKSVDSQINGPIQVDERASFDVHSTDKFVVEQSGKIHLKAHSSFEIVDTKLDIYQTITVGEHSELKFALNSKMTCLVLAPMTVANHTRVTITSANDKTFGDSLHCFDYGKALPPSVAARLAKLRASIQPSRL